MEPGLPRSRRFSLLQLLRPSPRPRTATTRSSTAPPSTLTGRRLQRRRRIFPRSATLPPPIFLRFTPMTTWSMRICPQSYLHRLPVAGPQHQLLRYHRQLRLNLVRLTKEAPAQWWCKIRRARGRMACRPGRRPGPSLGRRGPRGPSATRKGKLLNPTAIIGRRASAVDG